MVKQKVKEEKPKKLVLGDDAIEDFEADWFDFKTPASALADHLYLISKSSGVCCGIFGSWGSGKSSFMKLMDRHIRKEYSANICVAWFTAWDPGGIEDLGDAMLYRFFHDVTEGEKGLIDSFKELQQALGIRKSLRERARQALSVVSGAMPETATKTIMNVAGGLLAELDSPGKIKESFDKLMEWLEKNDKTVFFFVDDIDRATGEQIRDLLSELKVYVSHRRIVVVLGYDEHYVVGALKPVLPSGIEPKRYLEKMVTIGRYLPVPGRSRLAPFAANLLGSILKLEDSTTTLLANMAFDLSFGNPRRLKSLVLTFTDSLSEMKPEDLTSYVLESSLIVCAAAEMGLLSDENVKVAVNSGDEQEIVSALGAFSEKNSEEKIKANALAQVTQMISPNFEPNILEALRLLPSSSVTRSLHGQTVRRSRLAAFSWRDSFLPLLKEAASYGFKISSKTAVPYGIAVPSSTNVQKARLGDLRPLANMDSLLKNWNLYVLNSQQTDIAILLLSDFLGIVEADRRFHIIDGVRTVLHHFLDDSACFVSKKEFVLWMIDDMNLDAKQYYSVAVGTAKKRSRGLKHPFIFCYTLPEEMPSLLTLLLKAAKGKTGVSKTVDE